MYVDIRRKSKGQIDVYSPLGSDPISLEKTFENHERRVKTFKWFIQMDDENPEILEEMFRDLKPQFENSGELPERPEWK